VAGELRDSSGLTALGKEPITYRRRSGSAARGLRELVQERMQSVKMVLDTLVEDAPARQIVLRE
jgi:membrane peptidoglycan carboxypeptidase